MNNKNLLNLIILIFVSLGCLSKTVEAKDYEDVQAEVSFIEYIPDQGNLVLGVYSDGTLALETNRLSSSELDSLSTVIDSVSFKGKKLDTQLITTPVKTAYRQVLLIGLGEKEAKLSSLDWQLIGDKATQQSIKHFKSAAPVLLDLSPEHVANVAFGAKLAGYYFDKYYSSDDQKRRQDKITLVSKNSNASRQFYLDELNHLAKAIWYARDISNEPANVIYPESFVARWKAHLSGMDNVRIKVLDEKDMLKMNMGAIYGVGRGSKRPPRIMIVEYDGGKKGEAPVVIVGKGITFDTGGISIKKSDKMWNMKFDMSGAASAIGTVYALAGRKAKVNVIGIAALAENMPGGNAQRPGDVVPTMSGKTVQIRSTDAEGRLVLADAVYYADVTYKPKELIDLATLTGSAARALGKDYAALFSRHDDMVAVLEDAGRISGEEVWHLPLNKKHFKAIKNNVADVMNSGPSAPGASAGAAFIGTFINEQTRWAHLDIAGVAYQDDAIPFKASPGSRSFGIRLLNQYLKAVHE